jgi:hypothetical protein
MSRFRDGDLRRRHQFWDEAPGWGRRISAAIPVDPRAFVPRDPAGRVVPPRFRGPNWETPEPDWAAGPPPPEFAPTTWEDSAWGALARTLAAERDRWLADTLGGREKARHWAETLPLTVVEREFPTLSQREEEHSRRIILTLSEVVYLALIKPCYRCGAERLSHPVTDEILARYLHDGFLLWQPCACGAEVAVYETWAPDYRGREEPHAP